MTLTTNSKKTLKNKTLWVFSFFEMHNKNIFPKKAIFSRLYIM